MSLKEIFCQDRAIMLLQRALAAERISHAYIFAGGEGIGKFKTACEWARLLLCEKPTVDGAGQSQFADSCGSCKSCKLFDAGSHPDFNHIYKELREFTKDGKGKPPPVDMPIDVIREFVIAKAPMRPTHSAKKVFIVSEAEKLNASSQNCLLKILEEPPEYCCIILICTRLDKLLPTTRSRCQIVRFGPVAEERIIEKLVQDGAEQNQATYFARLSQGSLGLACRFAELERAGAGLYQIKKDVVAALTVCRLADSVELAENLSKNSKEISTAWSELEKTTSKTDISRRAAKVLIYMVASVFNDLMKMSVVPKGDIVNFDQQRDIRKLTERMDAEQAAQRITDCYRMLNWIESNVNEKLIFEQLLLNMTHSDRMTA